MSELREQLAGYEGEGVTDGARLEQLALEARFAPGVPAEYPFAVGYRGAWQTAFDGLQIAVRRHARALAATGLPVLLQSFAHQVMGRDGLMRWARNDEIDPDVYESVRALLDVSAEHLMPRVLHLVVSSPEHLRQWVLPNSVMALTDDTVELVQRARWLKESTIVFSVWERTEVSPEIGEQLAQVWNWVPSRQNRTALERAGVPSERIQVIPHPPDGKMVTLSKSEDVLRLRTTKIAARPELAPAQKRFYAINKWEPRKGLERLVRAFLRAFQPGADATLVIKTSQGSGHGGSVREMYERVLGEMPLWSAESAARHVKIIDSALEPEKILALHLQNNIYVSSSHAEGFGLAAYDAVTLGNRLVYIAESGGPEMYARPDDYVVPISGHAAVPASYGWGNALWPEYSESELMLALLTVEPPAIPTPHRPFPAKQIGALMADDVQRVVERGHAPAARFFETMRKA